MQEGRKIRQCFAPNHSCKRETLSKPDPQNWVTPGAGWTPSPSRFQWEGLNTSGNHQEANIGAKSKALYQCGAAWKGFVHPLPTEGLWTGAQTQCVLVPSPPSPWVLGCCQTAQTTAAQRISVDLPLQRAPCLVPACKEDLALASFSAPPWAGEPPALPGSPSPLVNISRLSTAQFFPSF